MLTEARAINDKARITGYGTINGIVHAFLLKPVLTSVQITGVARADTGNIVINGKGASSQSYGIEAAPTLTDEFVRIATIIATGDGTLRFEDADATAFTKRFYRFVDP